MVLQEKFCPNDIQAISACISDTYNLLDVLQLWQKHPDSALILNGAISDISMHIIESHNCLVSIIPETKAVFNSQEIGILKDKRHRGKVFDYTKDINDSIQDLVNVYEEQKKSFLQEHVGFLSSIKKKIQPDTALTKYNGHFITSSLSTLFELNIMNPTKEELLKIGKTIGQYTSSSLDIFEYNYPSSEINLDKSFDCYDIKGDKLIKRIGFSKPNNKYALSLILMATKLNYIKEIWSVCLPRESHTLFRIKFINAYHIAHNLSKIQSAIMKNNPTDIEKMALMELNNSKEMKWLKKQSQLRNLIVHYQVDEKQKHLVEEGMTRIEVIELFSKGKSYIDLNELLDKYISDTSQTLEKLFKIGEHTFWHNRVNL